MNIRQEPAEREYGIDWKPADEVSVGSVGWRNRPGGRMNHGVVIRLCNSDREDGMRITVSRPRARQIAIALAQASDAHWTQPGPLSPLPKRLSRLITGLRVEIGNTARVPTVPCLQGLKNALNRATENCGEWMKEARRLRALLDAHNIEHRSMDTGGAPPLEDEASAVDGFWPRICMCNQCGHHRTFASWAALEASPVCENCGEHALEGSGYCWCEMCGAPGTDTGGEVTQLADLIETRLLGVSPDDQDVQLEDDDWRKIVVALRDGLHVGEAR